MNSLTCVPRFENTIQWEKQVFSQDFFFPYMKMMLEENCFTFARLNHCLNNISISIESNFSNQFEKIIDIFGHTLKLNSNFALGVEKSKDMLRCSVSAISICDRVYESLAVMANIIKDLKLSEQKFLRDEFKKLPDQCAKTIFKSSLYQDLDVESTRYIVHKLLTQARRNEGAVIANAIEAIVPDELSPDKISFDSYLAIDECCEKLNLSEGTRKNLFNNLQSPIQLPDLETFLKHCNVIEKSRLLDGEAFSTHCDAAVVGGLWKLMDEAARQAPFRANKFFNVLHGILRSSKDEYNDKIMFLIANRASEFHVSKLAFNKLRNPELKKSVIRIFLSANKYYQCATTLDKYNFKLQECNVVQVDQSNLTELGKKENVIDFLESNTFQNNKNLFMKLSELIHKNEVKVAVDLVSEYATEYMKGLFLLEKSAIEKFLVYYLENQNLDMAVNVLSFNLPEMEYLRNGHAKNIAFDYAKKGMHGKAYQVLELATEPTKSWIKFTLDHLTRRGVDPNL